MNQLQIDYFLSVAETRNITESARLLFVSPPAVSRQIRAIEQEFGFPLFARTTRGVRLLPEGERLREMLIANQQKIAAFRQEVLFSRNGKPQAFRLGLPGDWMPLKQLNHFRRFLASQPTPMQLELHTADIFDLPQQVEDEEIDLLLYPYASPSLLPYTLHTQHICILKRVVLYGAELPLAKSGEPVTLQALSAYPLLISSERVLANSTAFCASHGISPEIRVLHDFPSVLQTVGMGVGFCLTDEWCLAANHESFGRLEMPDRAFASLVWKATNSSSWLTPMISFLSQEIANQ